MRDLAPAAAIALIPGLAAGACEGDLKGFMEKQPLVGGEFTPVQTFTINTTTNMIEQCERDNAFEANYAQSGDRMQFGYARRMRELTRVSGGTFVTGTWEAEFNGETSNYRIRVETK